MSIVDQNGNPIAYGWNDLAADEKVKANPSLRLISDEEFEKRFPEVIGQRHADARSSLATESSP